MEVKPDLYYLQNASMGYLGNAPYWWREGGSGYTPYIDEAKVWTEQDADSEIRTCKGTHDFRKWRVDDIMRAIAPRMVDLQLVPKREEATAKD